MTTQGQRAAAALLGEDLAAHVALVLVLMFLPTGCQFQ
jgi:hypothetical protein